MRINTNVASMVAQESSVNTNKALGSSLEKLSSGLRINKASDDSSGMAIADKLRTQASGIAQGISNANSANTFIQIADKAMGEQSNILDIVKTKLLQASTSTTSEDGRAAISKDINAMLKQLDQIAQTTNYNGATLLDSEQTFSFQIGEASAEKVSIITDVAANTDSGNLGSTAAAGAANLTSLAGTTALTGAELTADVAQKTMDVIDVALTQLNTVRAAFGSGQNQVESAIRNMQTTQTNIKAAESVIRDVDYAAESANFNKQNIIAQAGTYAMSQANSIQQNVLKLLQ